MKFYLKKELNLILRYPRVFEYNNKLFLMGSCVINQRDNLKQYWSHVFEIDKNFNVILESKQILLYEDTSNINTSSWIRDINIINNKIFLNVEIKININDEHYEQENYLYSTNDFINFLLEKKYNLNSSFLFKEINNILLISKIEKDEEFLHFFWGKYLFNFLIDEKNIIPKFDSIVNYKVDKGHLIHNILNIEKEEKIILFSIRHLINNLPDFIYKIYTAKTKDYINYYDTTEIIIKNDITDTKWYSYPSLFYFNNKYYGVSNQDEFGKNKNVILFEVELE